MAKTAVRSSEQATDRKAAAPDGAKAPGGKKSRLRVLVIRHGIAEDRKGADPDKLRKLTKPGRRKMTRAARGLLKQVPRLDALGSSPLTRAMQTADIVAGAYRLRRALTVPALAPGKSARALLAWLDSQPAGATIAIVGHEPDLSAFVGWTLTGLRDSFIPLKRGGACLLDFAAEVKPARATLVWAMKPSQLRALGKA